MASTTKAKHAHGGVQTGRAGNLRCSTAGGALPMSRRPVTAEVRALSKCGSWHWSKRRRAGQGRAARPSFRASRDPWTRIGRATKCVRMDSSHPWTFRAHPHNGALCCPSTCSPRTFPGGRRGGAWRRGAHDVLPAGSPGQWPTVSFLKQKLLPAHRSLLRTSWCYSANDSPAPSNASAWRSTRYCTVQNSALTSLSVIDVLLRTSQITDRSNYADLLLFSRDARCRRFRLATNQRLLKRF